jgi:hypothetical protein
VAQENHENASSSYNKQVSTTVIHDHQDLEDHKADEEKENIPAGLGRVAIARGFNGPVHEKPMEELDYEIDFSDKQSRRGSVDLISIKVSNFILN